MNNNNGRYEKRFPKDRFIEALTNEYQTTSQIAKTIGCGHSLAQKEMAELRNSKAVEAMLIQSGRGVYLYRRLPTISKPR